MRTPTTSIFSPLRKAGNSMIFSCLTPNPKRENLKIIESECPPPGNRAPKDHPEQTQFQIAGMEDTSWILFSNRRRASGKFLQPAEQQYFKNSIFAIQR